MYKIPVAVLGASGYTGCELIRILATHPEMQVSTLVAQRRAGEDIADIFPHLSHLELPPVQTIDQVDFSDIALAFTALPHGVTQSLINKLPKDLMLVDLSADFRLRDPKIYKKWYGLTHEAPEKLQEATFGIPEFYREQIKNSKLVANSGCYVAASLLALVPLIRAQLIDTEDIIISASSGVSGAGRAGKEEMLHSETSEGFAAYGLLGHRHSAEIDQECSLAAGRAVSCAFTPHLLPQNRGILATIYVRGNAEDIYNELARFYADEYFAVVLPFGKSPRTAYVRGSNYFHLGVGKGHRKDSAVILSTLDNLVKGASGQAIQNANLMLGLPENTGLLAAPIFP